jgi:putative oxidoreductase
VAIGLLILRTLLFAVLTSHALQKSTGWFGGPGLDGAAAVFEALGQRPARAMVRLASACELAAALLLGAGLATPVGAAIAAGTMLVAGASLCVHSGKFWNAAGGGEYPFVLAVVAASLGFTGAGRFSVDALLDAPWQYQAGSASVLTGSAAVGVAVCAAVVPVLRARRALRGPALGSQRG